MPGDRPSGRLSAREELAAWVLIDKLSAGDDQLPAQQYVPDPAARGLARVHAVRSAVAEAVAWQHGLAVRIEDHDVGVGAGEQGALPRVMAESPGRILRGELHNAARRKVAGYRRGQQQRQPGADSGQPVCVAVARRGKASGGKGPGLAMVRSDGVDCPVGYPLPQGFDITARAQRWRD